MDKENDVSNIGINSTDIIVKADDKEFIKITQDFLDTLEEETIERIKTKQ